MQPGWCQPVRQEFTENECEALLGVAYPGVRVNRSTLNTKTGYDDDAEGRQAQIASCYAHRQPSWRTALNDDDCNGGSTKKKLRSYPIRW